MPMDRKGRFGSYKPVALRLERGKKAAEARARAADRALSPVATLGRDIATTFWGKAWCQHLERYSDIANRLPRGRMLVRNGSVLDLAITTCRVEALVCGSELYDVSVDIVAAPKNEWRKLVRACGGRIDSVVELLAGRIASGVMEVLTDPKHGLFPDPGLIQFACSCPDAARLCKHVAAVLYGIGARLDHAPELLFVLRDVDANDLAAAAISAGTGMVATAPEGVPTLSPESVSELFGVEWEPLPVPLPAEGPRKAKRTAKPKRR